MTQEQINEAMHAIWALEDQVTKRRIIEALAVLMDNAGLTEQFIQIVNADISALRTQLAE